MTQALRKIEQELAELANNAAEGFPIDPFAIVVLAKRIGMQAEMVELGLGG